jgi:predicted enzyme related to lactoylglutathione lyase
MDVLASRILVRPRDFERSARFYGETLGLAVFREWRGGVVFFAGGGLLELSGPRTPPARDAPGDAVRVLLQVRDVHAEHRRLAAAGVPIVEEPETKPWGLLEMVVSDPDGLQIVVVEVPREHPQRRG